MDTVYFSLIPAPTVAFLESHDVIPAIHINHFAGDATAGVRR